MKQIPNILSVVRILLIPFFVWQLVKGNTLNAGIILIASGVTDFLDGQLARGFGWITSLGKVLDPFADKLTQAAISLCFIFLLKEYRVFLWIMIIKDVVMLVLGGWLMKRGVKIEGAKWFGKISTFMFYAVMISLLIFPSIPTGLAKTLMTIITGLGLTAGLLYVPDFINYYRGSKKH